MMELFEDDNNRREFCENMHYNVQETLKMWGDVLSQGNKHGWSNEVQFEDKDLYYAVQIFLTMCASRLHNSGKDMDMGELENRMQSFINDNLGICFTIPEKEDEENPENEEL